MTGKAVHVYMNHPGMAITPIAAHMFGTLYRLSKWGAAGAAIATMLDQTIGGIVLLGYFLMVSRHYVRENRSKYHCL